MDMSVGIITASLLTSLAAWITWRVVQVWISWRWMVGCLMKIPQGKTHWLLGHLHEFPGPGDEGLAFMRQLVADSPRIGCFWYGPFNCSVALVHPETMKVVLKTSEPKPIFDGAYRFIRPWLGDGLLLSSDRRWARNRRLLTPAFHFDILRPYVTVSNEAVDIMLDKMAGFASRKQSWDAAENVSLVTLDALLRCAFSQETHIQSQGSSHPYVKAVGEMTTALTRRLLSPWLYNDFIYFNLTPSGRRFRRNCDYVHSVSSDVIAARQKALAEKGVQASEKRYVDFIDVLLTARDNEGRGLTDQEIRDEADTFLFEGHDTTASAIMWTLYSLAVEPTHQRLCQEEVDDLLKGREKDHINWEDLSQLPYLTRCIKEAMRIHTPVPFIQRQLTDDLTVDGYFLPKGSIIDMHLYVLHHNPTVWTDSQTFDPDRFTSTNMAEMDSHAFVPFSAGPRNCIGQTFAMHELKIVVGRILHRFELSVAQDAPPVRHILSAVMRAENGVYLSLTPRQSQC